MPVTLQNRYAFSSFRRKPVLNPSAWRISAIGRASGCMGAYFPSANVAGPVIGGADVMKLVGLGNFASAIATSPEGLVHNFTTASHRFDIGAQFLAGNPTTGLQFSFICRLRVNTAPSAEADAVNITKTAGSAALGPTLSFTTGGLAKGYWLSGGSGYTGAATGSTNWIGAGFQTFGVSNNANQSATLYENGSNIATGSAGGGTDGASTTPGFMIGYYNGSTNLQYDFAWGFFFNKKLSDQEHWLFANFPWLLIEPIDNQLIGVAATGGTTLTIDFTMSADFGESIQANRSVPEEIGGGEKGDSAEPVDISASIQSDIIGLAAWLGSLAKDVSALSETGAAQRLDAPAPEDAGQSVLADRSFAQETGAGAAVTITVPLEFAGSGASIAVDFSVGAEWGAGQQRDAAAPLESAAALSALAVIMAAAGAGLATDYPVPATSAASLNRDVAAAIAALAQLFRDSPTQAGFALSLSETCTVQVEFDGSAIVILVFDPDGVIIGRDRKSAILGAARRSTIIGKDRKAVIEGN